MLAEMESATCLSILVVVGGHQETFFIYYLRPGLWSCHCGIGMIPDSFRIFTDSWNGDHGLFECDGNIIWSFLNCNGIDWLPLWLAWFLNLLATGV